MVPTADPTANPSRVQPNVEPPGARAATGVGAATTSRALQELALLKPAPDTVVAAAASRRLSCQAEGPGVGCYRGRRHVAVVAAVGLGPGAGAAAANGNGGGCVGGSGGETGGNG